MMMQLYCMCVLTSQDFLEISLSAAPLKSFGLRRSRFPTNLANKIVGISLHRRHAAATYHIYYLESCWNASVFVRMHRYGET